MNGKQCPFREVQIELDKVAVSHGMNQFFRSINDAFLCALDFSYVCRDRSTQHLILTLTTWNKQIDVGIYSVKNVWESGFSGRSLAIKTLGAVSKQQNLRICRFSVSRYAALTHIHSRYRVSTCSNLAVL